MYIYIYKYINFYVIPPLYIYYIYMYYILSLSFTLDITYAIYTYYI